jgi:hypothetical protein
VTELLDLGEEAITTVNRLPYLLRMRLPPMALNPESPSSPRA